MICSHEIKFLYMYFSKIMQTFYDLLFARSSSELLHPWIFFAINLFYLIDGEEV